MVAVVITAATVVAMVAVIITAATVVAMVAVIPNLIVLLLNLLEQKAGKIEVMEILLKTLNMRVVGAGEKGEYPKRVTLQTRQIRNPFL